MNGSVANDSSKRALIMVMVDISVKCISIENPEWKKKTRNNIDLLETEFLINWRYNQKAKETLKQSKKKNTANILRVRNIYEPSKRECKIVCDNYQL